jgi:hypothetical protein
MKQVFHYLENFGSMPQKLVSMDDLSFGNHNGITHRVAWEFVLHLYRFAFFGAFANNPAV